MKIVLFYPLTHTYTHTHTHAYIHTHTHTLLPQSFWVFVDPLVSDEMRLQLLALRNADSDVMKCRSWVRLMLSKCMMVSFLEDLQRHPGLLASHYGGESVIRDMERFEVIIQLMKGVSLFQFDCDYTSARLEGWNKEVLRLAGIWEGEEEKISPARGKSSPCMCVLDHICLCQTMYVCVRPCMCV